MGYSQFMIHLRLSRVGQAGRARPQCWGALLGRESVGSAIQRFSKEIDDGGLWFVELSGNVFGGGVRVCSGVRLSRGSHRPHGRDA